MLQERIEGEWIAVI